MTNYFSGTSGLVLPVPNKTYYPPEFSDKSRLNYYASLNNSIEVNSSFYKIPLARTVNKWAQEVGENFKFTYKLWRGITHEKGLIFDVARVNSFMAAINAAGNKKGCLLIQLPPSAKAGLMPQLQHLVNCVLEADADRGWQIAIEVRHASWYTDHLFEFAESNKISIVLQDIPASATPLHYYDIADTVYLRFHGPGGKYRGSYPDDLLYEYAGYIREWLEEGKTVYTYFNNTMGDAVRNLQTLNLIVNQGI
ncbi:DUF72 domain-containing protein [Mucilaginibacter calamicampi]|uniref:DUF72 domain-containing protein n=1 Tax=Mucilaginibacter calamicampi TaxID=1302352 RepID=A0ABW2Z1B3_9SPHI